MNFNVIRNLLIFFTFFGFTVSDVCKYFVNWFALAWHFGNRAWILRIFIWREFKWIYQKISWRIFNTRVILTLNLLIFYEFKWIKRISQMHVSEGKTARILQLHSFICQKIISNIKIIWRSLQRSLKSKEYQ